MTTREEFEAWHAENYPGHIPVPSEFAAWQASRNAALEEAAKECDLMTNLFDAKVDLDAADAAEQCAMGIRALKD